jgi:hypothetical protein
MSHETGHHKTKVAAELGLAGLGLAAAGTAGYLAYRKRHLEAQRRLNEQDTSDYLHKLALFANEKVDRLVPRGRHVMAATAVRIFYASRDNSEQSITKQQLLYQFGESNDQTLHVTPHKLQTILGFLSDNDLIARRPGVANPKAHGYYALPALEWGLEYGECPDVLLTAQETFIAEQF